MTATPELTAFLADIQREKQERLAAQALREAQQLQEKEAEARPLYAEVYALTPDALKPYLSFHVEYPHARLAIPGHAPMYLVTASQWDRTLDQSVTVLSYLSYGHRHYDTTDRVEAFEEARERYELAQRLLAAEEEREAAPQVEKVVPPDYLAQAKTTPDVQEAICAALVDIAESLRVLAAAA